MTEQMSFEKIIEKIKEEKASYFLTIANTGDEKLDAIYEAVGNAIDNDIKIVNQLAEEYNNGWIPCSERLPSEKGDYLVTCNDGKVRVWWFVVEKDFKCWLRGVHQLKPIAWQPLPPKYEPKEGGAE